MTAKEFLEERKLAYQLTFQQEQPANIDVLVDLARFCRANETCVAKDKNGSYDPHMTAVLEGRREVFIRIQQHLGLTPEQLLALYSGAPMTRRTS